MNSARRKRFEYPVFRLSIALIVIILAPHILAENRVGYVKEINGRWFLNSHRLLRGQALPPRGRITFQKSDISHCFINISDRFGQTIIHRNCDNRGECDSPIILPDVDKREPSFVGEIFGIIMDQIFHSEEGEYRSFISRGGALREAVVKLEDDKVDLSPAFVNMSSGKYLLRFVPKSRKSNAKHETSANMIAFDWNPERPTKLAIKNLTPGTYELQLLSLEDREQLEPGTEAWILVAEAGEYEKAQRSYSQAVAATSQWDKDTRPEAIRDFLRAYLRYLAAPKKK